MRVPSQASDVDQFLDDLFMPVLDGNLDELSDARSLAASLKGGVTRFPAAATKEEYDSDLDDDLDEEVASLTRSLRRYFDFIRFFLLPNLSFTLVL